MINALGCNPRRSHKFAKFVTSLSQTLNFIFTESWGIRRFGFNVSWVFCSTRDILLEKDMCDR